MRKDLKVVVMSNDCPRSVIKILEEHFTVVETSSSGYSETEKNLEELKTLLPGASAVMWLGKRAVTSELLDIAGPQLKIVATPSAGYNHCNVPELKSRGIQLSNSPDVLSAAVAEVAVALVLGVTRRFNENLQQVRDGVWETGFQSMLGQDVRGSTLGVLGLGGIGQATVKRLAAFEVGRVLYTGHKEKPEAAALNAQFVPLNELLRESDILLLSCPLTDETKHIINANALAKMKSNAIIVNIGRGDLIDQEALYTAIKNKQIYGAGLDVTTPEPLPTDHPLFTLPSVFILPHIGSATVRTRADMAELAAKNIVNSLQGKPLITPVLP